MLSLLATIIALIHLALPGSQHIGNYANQASLQAAQHQPATNVRIAKFSHNYTPDTHPTTPQKPLVARTRSALLYDLDSSSVLFEKSSHSRLPIASITKITTALTIMQRHKLTEVLTVPELPAAPVGSELLGIKPGEKFTVSEALHAMLIQSANDMAQALAIWDAGAGNGKESESIFAARMNDYANSWGLHDTHYVNATGLDEDGGYSSAADVITLGRILLRDPTLARIVSTRSYSVQNLAGKRYNVTTTNKLLGNGTVSGIKTGYTLAAGQCLLSLGKRNGHDVIGVVLGADDRFAATQSMLNWGFTNYTWE